MRRYRGGPAAWDSNRSLLFIDSTFVRTRYLFVTMSSQTYVVDKNKVILDRYQTHIGFRDVSFSNQQLFVNDQPFYCHGFGMHEDVEVRTFFEFSRVKTKCLRSAVVVLTWQQ